MKEELITVLMVNYNHEDTIKEAIESVLNQTYTNIQFVIVDDGSTDASCRVVNSFSDSRIELYHLEKNEHICYATNFGFSKIRGRYLARIDSDDIWYPDKLNKQIALMQRNRECKICFTWCDWIDEQGAVINDKVPDLVSLCNKNYLNQAEWLNHFYYEGNCLLHSSVLMETELLEETGLFEPAYRQLHDFDYWVRIVKNYNLFVIPEPLIAMRRYLLDKDRNASAVTEQNTTRTFNEFMNIRASFFDNMSDEVFVESFGSQFKCRDSKEKKELECEKAFLLCKPQNGWNGVPPEGLRRLKKLFRDINDKELLENKYNFSIKDLYELSVNHIYNDPIRQQALINLEQNYSNAEKMVDFLEKQISILEREKVEIEEEMNRQISLYADSTSWKLTKPLRKLGESLRKLRN